MSRVPCWTSRPTLRPRSRRARARTSSSACGPRRCRTCSSSTATPTPPRPRPRSWRSASRSRWRGAGARAPRLARRPTARAGRRGRCPPLPSRPRSPATPRSSTPTPTSRTQRCWRRSAKPSPQQVRTRSRCWWWSRSRQGGHAGRRAYPDTLRVPCPVPPSGDLAGPIMLKYLDKEGDLVTLSSRADIEVRPAPALQACTPPGRTPPPPPRKAQEALEEGVPALCAPLPQVALSELVIQHQRQIAGLPGAKLLGAQLPPLKVQVVPVASEQDVPRAPSGELAFEQQLSGGKVRAEQVVWWGWGSVWWEALRAKNSRTPTWRPSCALSRPAGAGPVCRQRRGPVAAARGGGGRLAAGVCARLFRRHAHRPRGVSARARCTRPVTRRLPSPCAAARGWSGRRPGPSTRGASD